MPSAFLPFLYASTEARVQGAQPLARGTGVSPEISPLLYASTEAGVQGAQPLAGGTGVSPEISPLFL